MRTRFSLLMLSGILGIHGTMAVSHARSERHIQPRPGFFPARDLPEGFRARVDSIDLIIRDALDGAQTHSEMEEEVFALANRLHIESRPGAIRRRLLFRAGDSISRDILLETERALRSEEFLADAFLEVQAMGDSGVIVSVTTFDQWTTTLGGSLQRLGGEWIYWLGLVESNLLGTGQRLGFFLGHNQFRDSKSIDYFNQSFLPYKLRLAMNGALLTDGYSYLFDLSRPLLSRTDCYSFNVLASGQETSERFYFDANDYDQAGVPTEEIPTSVKTASLPLLTYESVATSDIGFSVLRSFGYRQKVNVGLTFDRKERYIHGPVLFHAERNFASLIERAAAIRSGIFEELPEYRQSLDTLNTLDDLRRNLVLARTFENRLGALDDLEARGRTQGLLRDAAREIYGLQGGLPINERLDYLPGLHLSFYRYDYKTVSNFRNLKWSENMDVGWRITLKLAKNLEALGASNSDFYLSQVAVYNNTWRNAHFLNSSLSSAYFLSTGGVLDDGQVTGDISYQWKPIRVLSSFFSAGWAHLFATEAGQQLLLGEDNGLNGYPNQYYAGKARLLLEAEQRLFPPLEFGTVIPAFAVFLNAGNTFKAYDAFEPSDLHYSAGLGLRVGLSKSVQKLVNHLNVSWPLNDRHLKGPTISIRAKKSL